MFSLTNRRRRTSLWQDWVGDGRRSWTDLLNTLTVCFNAHIAWAELPGQRNLHVTSFPLVCVCRLQEHPLGTAQTKATKFPNTCWCLYQYFWGVSLHFMMWVGIFFPEKKNKKALGVLFCIIAFFVQYWGEGEGEGCGSCSSPSIFLWIKQWEGALLLCAVLATTGWLEKTGFYTTQDTDEAAPGQFTQITKTWQRQRVSSVHHRQGCCWLIPERLLTCGLTGDPRGPEIT